MVDFLENMEALTALYGTPAAASTRKVAHSMTPEYRKWIEASRFCVLSTVGPEGCDASPRGDESPVVTELDPHHLALPDWRGNNRLDSLRNIMRDPRTSLMFMVSGSETVIRVIGEARISADPSLLEQFERDGYLPRSVIVLKISEIYFQCARALKRSNLWSGVDESRDLPTPGQILASMTDGTVGGPDYDAEWPKRAAKTLW